MTLPPPWKTFLTMASSTLFLLEFPSISVAASSPSLLLVPSLFPNSKPGGQSLDLVSSITTLAVLVPPSSHMALGMIPEFTFPVRTLFQNSRHMYLVAYLTSSPGCLRDITNLL